MSQSFENKDSSHLKLDKLFRLVVKYLPSDHKVPGSTLCQVEGTLLIRSDIILSPHSATEPNFK